MSKETADKRNRAVVKQASTGTKDNVQSASRDARKRMLDALEDDDVREALKSPHSNKQSG